MIFIVNFKTKNLAQKHSPNITETGASSFRKSFSNNMKQRGDGKGRLLDLKRRGERRNVSIRYEEQDCSAWWWKAEIGGWKL